MEPITDIICVLLEKPFSTWKEEDKNDLLQCKNPQPILTIQKPRYGNSSKANTRNCQKSWYVNYSWLCGSHYLQKLFCWPCLLIAVKTGNWNKIGFDNLISATRSFQIHESSSEHIKNLVKFKKLKQNRYRIADAVLHEKTRLNVVKYNEKVRLNRFFMHHWIDAVLYLCKQELAFLECNEKTLLNHGNFKELLSVLVKTSSLEIQQHYTTIKAVFEAEAKIIQNELIECISKYIKTFIENELAEVPFYSVQVDDTTDFSETFQCSLILRYITTKGVLVERFFGFYNVNSNHTAQTVFELLSGILSQFNYKTKLIAQCYDGASVMSGLNDLQAKIKEVAPQAIIVHSLTHHLNFVFKQSVSKIIECRIFFASIDGISSFFRYLKRTFIANSTVLKRIPIATGTSYASSYILKVLVEEWDGLKEMFEKLVADAESDEKMLCQICRFLSEMNDFQFIFLSIIFNDIFKQTDVVFDILQKHSLDVNFCHAKIKLTTEMLSEKRTNKNFEEYFCLAEKKTKFQSGFQSRNETVQNFKCDEAVQKFKCIYFEILDTIITEIETRFQDLQKLTFFSLADSTKFKEYSITFPLQLLRDLKNFHPSVDDHRLKNELDVIYSNTRYRNLPLENIVTLLYEEEMNEVTPNEDVNKICSDCLEKLTQAYIFQMQCLEANRKLQMYFSTKSQRIIRESKNGTISSVTDSEKIFKNNSNNCAVNSEAKFPCTVCSRIFSSKYTMHRHLKIHSSDNNLKCEICFKQFSRKTDVKRHMTLHTGERPYHCLVCNATFTQSSTLARHVRSHNEYKIAEPKKLKSDVANLCFMCGKSFKNSTSLTIHMRRHRGDKPYQCNTCHMSFVTRGRLTCHSRVHTGERPFKCKVCGKNFAQSSVIGKHMKIHTGERKYMCNVCSKGFRTLYYLNIHKRIHTGEKPEQCTVCYKRFSDPKGLKHHKKTHTNEKPLLCNICGKCFARYHHFRTHMKSHKI